ncbi:MAG: TRAP transporter small permease subunit [Proteobacteria bacterium]|nr:TRAP transporter small permease subunit [Pseudomonadota bacterium]
MGKMAFRDKLAKVITAIGATFTFVIGTIIGLQIFTRTFLNRPLSWPEELSQFLLIALTFLGTGIIEREDAHIRVEFIFTKTSKSKGILIRLVGRVLTLFFLICMLLGEKSLIPRVIFVKSPAARVPYIWLHLIIIMGVICWTLYVFLTSKELIRAYRESKNQ